MTINIVGAGLTGITLANLLSPLVEKVNLFDYRDHIGGNCYDYYQNDVLTHRYGAHLFHTNSKEVFNYLSQFTEWHEYKHIVKVLYKGKYYDMPINRVTINKFFDIDLKTEEEVKEFLEKKRYKINPSNAEEQVLSKVGKELYEAFFKNYTIKQWNRDPKELDKSITARIPVRYNDNPYYFNDKYQCMPEKGYTEMFKKMLDKDNISVKLNTKIQNTNEKIDSFITIWTGKIDEYYNFEKGKLDYRSLDFEFTNINTEFYQKYAVVNYTRTEPFTRILEMKYATGQKIKNTVIVKEFPSDNGEPYYPVIDEKNLVLLKEYQKRAKLDKNLYFSGRLGTYRYLNMDRTIEEAFKLFEEIKERI